MLKRILIALAFILAGAPAYAQSTWPTPQTPTGGPTVTGGVGLCLNASGQAVPCGASTPGYTIVLPSYGTGGWTAATIGVTSAQVLAADSTRKSTLAIQNVSTTATIACSFSGAAALNTAGSFTIQPSSMLSFSTNYVPQEAMTCISSAASTPATVIAK